MSVGSDMMVPMVARGPMPCSTQSGLPGGGGAPIGPMGGVNVIGLYGSRLPSAPRM